jgi:hypothetical protein
MPQTLTPEHLQCIHKRHRGYVYLLAVISVVLLLQPLAVDWPLLTSSNSIAVASVMMVCLTRYSPLRSTKYWVYGLGVSAISFEVIWLATLARTPELAKHLSIPHLMIWSIFISLFLMRQVRALMIEPFVNLKVLMGATSGYLLIGYLGAFLLHSLLIWQPLAFNSNYLPARINPITEQLRAFPSMVTASFEALTTISNSVCSSGYILARIGTLTITILGQLYVAVLIGLVLSRFQNRLEPQASRPTSSDAQIQRIERG